MIHSLKEIVNTGTKEQPVFTVKPQPPKIATDQDKVLILLERWPHLNEIIQRLQLDLKR